MTDGNTALYPRFNVPRERDTRTITVIGEPRQGGLSLLVVSAGTTLTFPLPAEGTVVIGRGDDADLQIREPWISRRHAAIHIGGELRFEDLGGSNRARVRGATIPKGATISLAPGDVIELASTRLIVQHDAAAEPVRDWSHRYFEERLDAACAQAARFGLALAVVRVVLADPLDEASIRALSSPDDLVAAIGRTELELALARKSAAELDAAIEQLLARVPARRSGIARYGVDGRSGPALVAAAGDRARGPASLASGPIIVEPAMRELIATTERVAAGDIHVLVVGETGVGKELFAELVHRRSPRRGGPLVRINCAAVTETLLESELFGHEKGAFTGAVDARPGLLETAHGGTMFLDEVAELSPALQAKLLRVLEHPEVLRVGGRAPRPLDVRFVAATNRDLDAEVARGRFRADLYYRLAGVTIAIPPLRARPADLEPLARSFAADAWQRLGRSGSPRFAPEALAALSAHAWPGNVRELRNTIERAVLLCDGDLIVREHLPVPWPGAPAATDEASAEPSSALRDDVQRLERSRIEDALARCKGNRTHAAKLLGIARNTLIARMKAYGLR
jgi:two-component system, NtrC family, response regulator AtoC